MTLWFYPVRNRHVLQACAVLKHRIACFCEAAADDGRFQRCAVDEGTAIDRRHIVRYHNLLQRRAVIAKTEGNYRQGVAYRQMPQVDAV